MRIGIIICGRYQNCAGGKCFRSVKNKEGAFSIYDKNEPLEVVGFTNCGGCPGGNIEYVPEEMISNGAEAIHLATGMVVGYPPCPYIKDFKQFIEKRYQVPVVIGTHPIPLKYMQVHNVLDMWENHNMTDIAAHLLNENKENMEAYN